MELGLEKRLALPFDEAVEKTRAAFKAEGFGVLTEIDVKKTLHEKIGAEFRRYVILGTCNPPLAHRALSDSVQVGLLLPCNVIVYEEGGESVVSAMNPALMAEFFRSDTLGSVASEAKEKIEKALDSLK